MAIRHSGLALMAGVVLVVVAALFLPGNAFVSPVDQTDFVAARDALGDSANLAQWMTFITLVSLLLLSFGLLGLYPAASRQGGLGGRLLQFGVIVSLVEWSVLIIASGMRHLVIHLLQRGDLPDDGSLSAADFKAAALAVHTDMTAVTLTFIALLPLATIMVGIGLSQRFGSMDIYKLTSYVVAIGGIIGLVIYLTAMNAPDLGIQTLLWINSVQSSVHPVDRPVHHRVRHVQGTEGVLCGGLLRRKAWPVEAGAAGRGCYGRVVRPVAYRPEGQVRG